MRRIPSNLAAIRRSKLLSQVDLAIDTGIRSGIISQIERRKRIATLEEAERIANALGVPSSNIFGDPEGGDR